ncbi:MAG TPA: hypothetical protein VG672_27465, partial [Bryobacteraceae bacterium]|nr:hypothetical protein [Bryobacteraceae bacterium]
MAALRDTLANALDTTFRSIQADVHEADKESAGASFAHGLYCAAACERRLDGKALALLEVLAGPADHFP